MLVHSDSYCNSPRCLVTHTQLPVWTSETRFFFPAERRVSLYFEWRNVLFSGSKCQQLSVWLGRDLPRWVTTHSEREMRDVKRVHLDWGMTMDHSVAQMMWNIDIVLTSVSRVAVSRTTDTNSLYGTRGALLDDAVVRTVLQYASGHEYKINSALIRVCMCVCVLALSFPFTLVHSSMLQE